MGSQDDLVISSRREATHVVVTLVGELDMTGSAGLAAEVRDALAGTPIDALELDLSGLTFADSAGLHAILSAREDTRLAGVTLRLVGVTPVVSRVIHLAGVDHLLLPTAGDADSA